MTNTLYESTKKLIALIKEKKNPEIEIESDYLYDDLGAIWHASEILAFGLEESIPKLTSQSLLTLIPQLFGPAGDSGWFPESLTRSLLQKYFVDGLWLESQEAVIEDIINNINTYL